MRHAREQGGGPAGRMDLWKYRYLSVAGGGLAGTLYHASLTAIDGHLVAGAGREGARQWWEGLRGVAGCSAGAMVALCVLVSLPLETTRDFCLMASKRHWFMRNPDLGSLAQRFGLDDASGLHDIAARILERGGLSRDITFRDLHRYVPVEFVVVAADIEREGKLYLSHRTYPDMRVRDAVVASCSIPFVYVPTTHCDGLTLCDGGLCENQPVVFPVEQTLNLSVCVPRSSGLTIPPNDIDGVVPFCVAVMRTISAHQSQVFDPRHTLYCVAPGTEASIDTFSFTDEDEDKLADNLLRVRLYVTDQLRGRPQVRSVGRLTLLVTALRRAAHSGCADGTEEARTPRA